MARVNDPNIKDPSVFKDPTDRQAATLARAQRILANPKFQALDQDTKNAVLKDYYTKHVISTYKDAGFAIPDEAKWISGIQDKNLHASPADYYGISGGEFANFLRTVNASALEGAADLFNHISVAGINVGEKAARQYLNLDKFYQAHNIHNGPFSTELAEELKKDINKTSHQVTDAMGFWMDTHPSKSWTHHAATFIGENLVQLPFYEAVGIPLKATGMLMESAKPIANLTKALTSTPHGRFIARRLSEASGALIASVLQGESSEDTSKNMLSFMGLGMAGEAGGLTIRAGARLTIAGASLVKWFTARTLAMGGTPLQEAVTQHAMHEMEHDIVGSFKNEPITKQNVEDIKTQKIAEFLGNTLKRDAQEAKGQEVLDDMVERKIKPSDVSDKFWNETYFNLPGEVQERFQKYLYKMTAFKPGDSIGTAKDKSDIIAKDWHDIAKGLVGDSAEHLEGIERGYVVYMQQANERFAEATSTVGKDLIHKALASSIVNDEVKEKMNMAEKISLTSLGMEKYNKPWNQLSQAQRRVIKAQRDNLTAEAIKELPLHNEDLAKANTEAQVKADEKENPKLAEKNAAFEKQFGVKVSDALHEAETDYVKKATGADNILSAAKSTAKTAKEQEDISFKTKSERVEQEPRQYVSFKVNSLQYFKNVKSSFDKAKDKVQWTKDLEDMSDEDFIHVIKNHAPDLIFEKDKDALLWAYNYKSNFPAPFKDRIDGLLQDKLSTSERQWATEAKNLEAHMENLAYTGQLFSEGNVFRSTDTSGSPTKWQRQHSREYQKQEFEDYLYTMKPLMKNHKQDVIAGGKMLKQMQKLREDNINNNEPRQAIEMNKRIRSFAQDTYQKLVTGN